MPQSGQCPGVGRAEVAVGRGGGAGDGLPLSLLAPASALTLTSASEAVSLSVTLPGSVLRTRGHMTQVASLCPASLPPTLTHRWGHLQALAPCRKQWKVVPGSGSAEPRAQGP